MASRPRQTRRVLAMLATLGVIAAACASDDSDDSASGVTVDDEARSGAQEQVTSDATDPGSVEGHPGSMEAWEELWSAERAAIVERIQENGWGLSEDGSTLTGPEGFTVDISQCPTAWSDTQGVTDGTVKFGYTSPQSGTAADFGHVPKGFDAFLQHYAEEGRFVDAEGEPLGVDVLIRDDAYDSARTVPLVDELIDSEKVFATLVMGSPNSFAVYDKLNDRCIPEPLSVTGHPAWGDPMNHPWTTGFLLSYATEALLWGTFIEQNIDEWGGSAKVAAVVWQNDFGKAYQDAFESFLESSPRRDDIEFFFETAEVNAPTIKDQMTTIAAQQPDVYIAMLGATPCTQSITEAAENGMKQELKALFLPSVCKPSTYVGKEQVGGDGMAADGWWIIGGGYKDFTATANDDDAFVAYARDVLAEQGYNYQDSANYGLGVQVGWAMAQAMMIAQELDRGLTRTNLVLALRTMDMTHPLLLPGIGFNMNGNADSYLVEGSDVARWNAADQQWETETIVELSGQSDNCAWDPAQGACA